MKNTLLRKARLQKGWSQQQLADFAGVGLATVGRAERGDSIRIDNIQRLCACLEKTPDQLGLVRVDHTNDSSGQPDGSNTIESAREVARDAVGDPSSPGQNLHRLTEDQSLTFTTLLKLGETIMFDPKKREMLQTLLTALSFAAVKPQGLLQPEAWQHFLSPETDATRVNEATMQGFEKLMAACWRLSWGNELALAEELLPSCMSRLVPLAQQSSKYQQTAANLAAQGFRLYGIFALHRNDLLSRELYYKQAVQYSLLSGDTPLIITAFIGQGDTYYYMKNQYGTALQAYQNALPYAKEASPLFQSKVYLSLAVASAHMDQKQDSLRFLGLAHDTFPDRPETDASFSYAEHNRSHMILGEGIVHSQLGQTNMALDIFARAEHPDIIIPERLRVEIFNQQAKTAIISGDLEQGSAYVEAGVTGARTLSSQKRYNEAYENFKQLSLLWPQEKRVKALADVFQSH
jgi:tetratricopeptide (TPR) repeat protein/DNA-binding Xre family transcriptional regulator